MNAKRKPKPVKAWIVIDEWYADPEHNMVTAVTKGQIYATRIAARRCKMSYERIARVEIREVGR